jgi:hypothetical protein
MMAVPSLEQVAMLSCENLHVELKSVSVTTGSPSKIHCIRNTVLMTQVLGIGKYSSIPSPVHIKNVPSIQ